MSLALALAQLKQDLAAIMGKTITYNETGIEQLSDAEQTFANPTFFDDRFKNARASASSTAPQASSYSTKVVQALWNIADLTEQTASSRLFPMAAVSNTFALARNFNYLQTATQVPKIIDDKSYNAGLALLEFINNVTQGADAPRIIPGSAVAQIVDMKNRLTNRINIYKFHMPQEIIALMQFRNDVAKKISAWEEESIRFVNKTNRERLAAEIAPGNALLTKALQSSPAAMQLLDETLASQLQLIASIKAAIPKFAEFNTLWRQENLDKFPAQMTTSHYLDALSSTHPEPDQVASEWRKLLNGETNFQTYAIHSHVNGLFERGVLEAENATDTLAQLEQQVAQLQARRASMVALATFEQQLDASVAKVPALATPDFIDFTPPAKYLFPLSRLQNESTRLDEDNKNYSQLITNLKAYELRLIKQQQDLEAHRRGLESNQPQLPPEATGHESVFLNAVEKARVSLTGKISDISSEHGKLNAVRALTANAIAAQKLVREEILLRTAQDIATKFPNAQRLPQEYALAKSNVPDVPDESNPTLRGLRAADQLRIQSLQDTDAELATFEKLLKQTTMYIPADKMPKKRLKELLQVTGGYADDFINKLYTTYDNAYSLYGANLTNATSILSHHLWGLSSRLTSRLLSPMVGSLLQSEFSADQDTLLHYINSRREQITAELAIDIKVANPHDRTKPGDNDRHMLREQYQQALKPGVLREQILDELELTSRVAVLDHGQSMVESDLYRFEFYLADIQDTQTSLRDLVKEVDGAPDGNAALILIQKHNRLITQAQKWFSFSQSDRIQNPTELHALVGDRLAAHKKSGVDIEALKEKFKVVPATLQVESARLHREFTTLTQRKAAADTQYNELTELLNSLRDRKEKLQLQKLLQLNESANRLDSRIALLSSLDPSQQNLLLDDLRTLKLALDQAHEFLADVSKSVAPDIVHNVALLATAQQKLQQAIDWLEQEKQERALSAQLAERRISEQQAFDARMTRMKSEFFGSINEETHESVPGLFDKYLQERAQSYFFSDFISQIAAFMFSYFDYKTEASLRQEYLNALEGAFLVYEKHPETQYHNNLQELIDEGFQRFSPRAEEDDEEEYSKSLHFILRNLQRSLAFVPPLDYAELDDEEELSDSDNHSLP